MITASETTNGTGAILITSTSGKQAKIWDFKSYWQIVYEHNGARKNFNEYHEAIAHLTAKGW